MATRKQIAANRRNAKKAAGPKTIPGKIRSSRNAVKYGLLCQNFFQFPWEDSETFQLMHARLLYELQPQGEREQFLAGHIFSLYWRLQRAAVVETGIILHRVQEVMWLGSTPYAKLIATRHLPDDSGRETAGDGDPAPNVPWVEKPFWLEAPPPRPGIADLGRAHILDVQDGDALSKVRRHETSLENSLIRAVRELERLQEKRIGSMPPASSEHPDLRAPEGTNDPGSDGKAA